MYFEYSNGREIVESVERVEGKSISFKSKVTVTDDTSVPDGYYGFVQHNKPLTCTEKYCSITFTLTFTVRLITTKKIRLLLKIEALLIRKDTPNQQC